MGIVYNQIANRSLERIGALSDGVFAIAMTLIVLEIRVPALSPAAGDGDRATALVPAQDLRRGALSLSRGRIRRGRGA